MHGSLRPKAYKTLQESAAGIGKGSKSAMLVKHQHSNRLRARTVRCRVRLLRPTPRLAWLLKPSCCTQEEGPCRAEARYVTEHPVALVVALCAGPLLLACRLAFKAVKCLALDLIPEHVKASRRAAGTQAWGDSSGPVRRGNVGCSGHSPAAHSWQPTGTRPCQAFTCLWTGWASLLALATSKE